MVINSEGMSTQNSEQQYQGLVQQLWEALKAILAVMPVYVASDTSARLAFSFIRHLIIDASTANISIDSKLLVLIIEALDKAVKETVGSVTAPSMATMATLSTIGELLTKLKPQETQQASGEKRTE
jgi:hypothetical protein